MTPRPGRGGESMSHIGDVLKPAVERLGAKTLWAESKVRRAWPAVVGPEICEHAHVFRLRGTALEVHVTSDAWATELTYMQAMLIERLNSRVGAGTVAEIVVRKARRSRS